MARGRTTSLTIYLTPAERRHCWRGNGPPLSRQDMPDGAGLSYSWLTG